MKQFFIFTLVGLSIISCKETRSQQEDVATISEEATPSPLNVFGDDFKNETTLTAFELGDIYKNLKVGDTVKVTFEGPVEEVCQAKGCWMTIDVGAVDPVMVKFKDYAFFVP